MVNAEFNKHIAAHMAGVLAKYQATKTVSHPGEKGNAREALCAAAVEPWFGPAVAIDTGFMIDSLGNKSLQCDDIFYWPDLQPRISLGHATRGPGLFPIEGVAAVVEVKSTLTTTELGSALKNLEQTHFLKALSTAPMLPNGEKVPHFQMSHLTSIVAFDSKVAIKTLKDALVVDSSWDLVLVLGSKGGLFANSRTGDLLELLPATESDVQKLAVYSILVRDHIQDSRAYRVAASLESYMDFDATNATKFGTSKLKKHGGTISRQP